MLCVLDYHRGNSGVLANIIVSLGRLLQMFMAVSNQESILKTILIEALYIWKVVK